MPKIFNEKILNYILILDIRRLIAANFAASLIAANFAARLTDFRRPILEIYFLCYNLNFLADRKSSIRRP